MPNGIRCETCGRFAEEVDYRLVPQAEIVFWARHGDSVSLDKGWYWCPECNWWEHDPSIEMIESQIVQHLQTKQ